jgi:adenosine deaminase
VAPAAVFRALILAFALAEQDPRFVGVNIVQPEDWPVARADYDLHMAMFRFLAQRHPGVAVSMHAGELAFGRRAACRSCAIISARPWLRARGASAMAWTSPMRIRAAQRWPAWREGVAVEINLTSNAVILGVKGAEHPLELYRRHGVPVVLATDDEGVLRTDLTREYQRAVQEHGLGYADLKAVSRASLEYSFHRAPACGATIMPTWALPCATALGRRPAGHSGRKAKGPLQLDLEQRFARFEEDARGRREFKRNNIIKI